MEKNTNSLHRRIILNPVTLLFSGALLGFSTAFPFMFLVSFLALIPFFFLIEASRSMKEVGKDSFLFGLGFFGAVYFWFWGVYPLDWIGVQNDTYSFGIIMFAWVVTAVVLSVTMVGRALFMHFLKSSEKENGVLIVPIVWILFEYVGAVTFSLLWAGPQSTVGAHWTFGFLGYALAEIPIARSLAAIGGVYLLSFTLVFIVSVIYFVSKRMLSFKKINSVSLVVVAAVLLIGSISGYGVAIRANTGVIKEVLLVHTAFPSASNQLTSNQKEERSSEIIATVTNAIRSGAKPDILIFPESSEVLNSVSPAAAQSFLETLAQEKNTLVLNPTNDSNARGELISSIWYARAQEGVTEVRHKSFLVPVGEYAPYIGIFFSNVLHKTEWFERIYAVHGYYKVRDDEDAFRASDVGILQCSESISPYLYRDLAKTHAILANAASHAAFRHSALIRDQILKMERIHAVANDRFFIQSGNVAPSLIITNTGALRSFLNNDETDVLIGEVKTRTTLTPYVRWGEWFLLLSCALLIIVFFQTVRDSIVRRNILKKSESREMVL